MCLPSFLDYKQDRHCLSVNDDDDSTYNDNNNNR